VKRIAIAVLLISFLGTWPAQGKNSHHNSPDYPVGNVNGMIFKVNHQYIPHTGDSDFDSLLIEINRTAGGRFERYIGDICTGFHIPQEKVMMMIYQEEMQPADVFMALQFVRLSGQSYQKIMNNFRLHKRKGWGAVALSLGLKPGSKIFILLRQDVPYVIWNYAVAWQENHSLNKGSKGKKGSKRKKGSKGKK